MGHSALLEGAQMVIVTSYVSYLLTNEEINRSVPCYLGDSRILNKNVHVIDKNKH